ncbi:hypothetical protein AB0G85_36525 [Streptomyces sioyaensis]|uniref:hypothetical protein n=1 Tax=Streptomyces sioyaensis TaxID=67364 RepID=UPI0033E836C9
MRSPHRLASAATAIALAAAGLILTTGSAHAAACSQSHLPLPDATCRPGAYNPTGTQPTIKMTICVPGWTKTVRPPVSYTAPLKIKQIGEYGYSDTSTADYEEDHFVPLELGGAPRDPKNLWPEPRYGDKLAASKDPVENKLKLAVCDGTVKLDAARSAIATDWTTALAKVGIG